MKLDHVVYFTNSSPEQIVARQQKLGQHAVIGGRHEHWGTQNALLYTRNGYVEWLSVEKPEIAQNAHHPLTDLLLHDLKNGEGWGTICISVQNIEQFDKDIQQRNFKTSGVIAAQRKTPNGGVRKWKMLFIDQPVSDQLPLPFFIEWEETEEIRFETLRKEGIILPCNDALKITECVFRINDPLKEVSKWAELLSQKISKTSQLALSNTMLKFMPAGDPGKERLSEVVIEPGPKSGFLTGNLYIN